MVSTGRKLDRWNDDDFMTEEYLSMKSYSANSRHQYQRNALRYGSVSVGMLAIHHRTIGNSLSCGVFYFAAIKSEQKQLSSVSYGGRKKELWTNEDYKIKFQKRYSQAQLSPVSYGGRKKELWTDEDLKMWIEKKYAYSLPSGFIPE